MSRAAPAFRRASFPTIDHDYRVQIVPWPELLLQRASALSWRAALPQNAAFCDGALPGDEQTLLTVVTLPPAPRAEHLVALHSAVALNRLHALLGGLHALFAPIVSLLK